MDNSNDETFNEQRRKLRRREGPTRILPFVLKRRQFPIQPAFSMTINKAQGQTFKLRRNLFVDFSIFSWPTLCC